MQATLRKNAMRPRTKFTRGRVVRKKQNVTKGVCKVHVATPTNIAPKHDDGVVNQLPARFQNVVSEPQEVSESDHFFSAVGRDLLSDIHEIFRTKNVSKMKTKRLLVYLCADHQKPWSAFKGGKKLGARQLASILKPYGIHSKDIRFKSGVVKGYRREWFSSAKRHLNDKTQQSL